jgi:lipid II:glycine glycyltransferase (peptidoglycan interpeptide bridge formation enzyme)
MIDVVWTRALAPADAEQYDRFVLEAPSGHFAQTRAWAPVVRASRPCATRFFLARDGGRVVAAGLVARTTALGVPLPFASLDRGPVFATPADAPLALAALRRAARLRGVARVVVMPYWADADAAEVTRALAETGFTDVQALDGAHARTVRIDVAGKNDAALLAGGEREQVRRRVRQAEKAGATARRGEDRDFDTHRALMRELMEAQGKHTRNDAWFEALRTYLRADDARGALFVGEHEGKVLSTVVVLRHGTIATYAYGASASLAVKFPKAVLPLVAAVRWARDQGCATFDLGGVPLAEDTDPKRAAIAEFKLDFGKTRVDLVREHARVL